MDKSSIKLVFSEDKPIKFIIVGILLAFLSYFAGGINILFLFLFIALLFISFLKIEIALLTLPSFVLVDFVIKKYTNGFKGLWDEGLFLFLLILIIYRMYKEKRFNFKFTSIIYPIIAFIIIGIVSTFYSKYVSFAQGIEGIRSVIQSFVFFIIIINSNISKESLRFLLIVSVIVAFLTAFYGIFQYVAGVSIPPNWLDKDSEIGIKTRAFSFLGSPNALAAYCVLFLPISLSFIFKKKLLLSHKVIFFLIFITLTTGLVSTLTRAAWLAFIPALFLFGILTKQFKVLFLIILLICSVVIFVKPIRNRFTNLFSDQYQQKSEIGGRTYRWDLAFTIFEENPVLGIGPGGYGGAVAYRSQAFSGLYVDNYYLEILSNYGFLGLFIFLWIIYEIFRKIIKSIKFSTDDDKYLIYGIISGLFGFFIHNFTENLWEVVPLTVTVWFLAGVAVSLSNNRIGGQDG